MKIFLHLVTCFTAKSSHENELTTKKRKKSRDEYIDTQIVFKKQKINSNVPSTTSNSLDLLNQFPNMQVSYDSCIGPNAQITHQGYARHKSNMRMLSTGIFSAQQITNTSGTFHNAFSEDVNQIYTNFQQNSSPENGLCSRQDILSQNIAIPKENPMLNTNKTIENLLKKANVAIPFEKMIKDVSISNKLCIKPKNLLLVVNMPFKTHRFESSMMRMKENLKNRISEVEEKIRRFPINPTKNTPFTSSYTDIIMIFFNKKEFKLGDLFSDKYVLAYEFKILPEIFENFWTIFENIFNMKELFDEKERSLKKKG